MSSKTRNVFDVAVLGAGSLGLNIASQLAGHGLRVLVLERTIGIGAMSTNMAARLGSRMFVCNDEIAALTEIGMTNYWEKSSPILNKPRAEKLEVLYLAYGENYKDELKKLTDLAAGTSRCDWRTWGASQIRSNITSLRDDMCVAGVAEQGLRLSTSTMIEEHLQVLQAAAGLVVIGGAPHEVRLNATNRWLLQTELGCFEAADVVIATGAEGDSTLRMFGAEPIGLIDSIRHRLIAQVSSPERLTRKGLFVFLQDLYWTQEAPGTIMCSPADETDCEASDWHPRSEIKLQTKKKLGSYLGISVEGNEIWTAGHRPRTSDRLPVLGTVSGYNNLHCALAPGGYGIQAGPAMAEVVVSAVLGEGLSDVFASKGLSENTFSPNRFKKLQTAI